jgi:hypothetical protein
MLVTVFGSCRQSSIRDYFNTTNIQDTLTFPHYTKEVIQAISYCKGISNIKLEDTTICFSWGILKNAVINLENLKK